MQSDTFIRAAKTAAYTLAVFIAGYVMAVSLWYWASDLLALGKNDATATVTITEGESIDEVADDLAENGLIQYKWLFKLFANVTGKSGSATAGTYELNTTMDYSALLNGIGSKSETKATVTVTIPEGYTAEETLTLLEESGVCSYSDLTEAAETNLDQLKASYSFLEGCEDSENFVLEGFLFPDTYEFYANEDALTVLEKLLANFDAHLTDDLLEAIENDGWTVREAVIAASIIEKETDGSDQKDISSVIWNRLDADSYLQMDSTIQFLLPERTDALTTEDILIASDYNTYLVKGLPIGPICSPGETAINAAVYPNDTDYYYFAVGDDGITHFFSDASEFMAFVGD